VGRIGKRLPIAKERWVGVLTTPGLTLIDMAVQLERTTSTVKNRARRLGIRLPWVTTRQSIDHQALDLQVQTLRLQGLTCQAIADRTRTSRRTIVRSLGRLQLKRKCQPIEAWQALVPYVQQALDQGYFWVEIAGALQVHPSTLTKAMKRVGGPLALSRQLPKGSPAWERVYGAKARRVAPYRWPKRC
jgi:hypothetical protein